MHLRKVCPLFPPTNWWFLMSKCLQEAWVNMLFPEKIQAPWVLEVLGKPSRCQQEISIQNIPWSGETSSTVDFDEFKMVTFVISHVVLVVFLPTWSCNSMGRNAGVISLRCCSTCWTHPRKGMIKQTYFSCILRSRVQSRRLRRTRNFWVILLEVWHVPTHIYIYIIYNTEPSHTIFRERFFVSQPLPPFFGPKISSNEPLKNPCHKLLKMSLPGRVLFFVGSKASLRISDLRFTSGLPMRRRRCQNPSRDLPRAMIMALMTCACLYVAMASKKKTAQKGEGKKAVKNPSSYK